MTLPTRGAHADVALAAFRPFGAQPERAVLSVGQQTLELATDGERLVLSGTLTLGRDEPSQRALEQLLAVLRCTQREAARSHTPAG